MYWSRAALPEIVFKPYRSRGRGFASFTEKTTAWLFFEIEL
ncbi:hypothetical protein ASZ90_020125 [hydrocarbon metagenome]|uniref:Uncharacterized protein n=1 Tax=hydrocarbon metagenome TaxID=938273 RepID=A0A0W8E236_9ZZZZ